MKLWVIEEWQPVDVRRRCTGFWLPLGFSYCRSDSRADKRDWELRNEVEGRKYRVALYELMKVD